MKLHDILEGTVSQFPIEKRQRQVRMDKLRKKSHYYDELTGLKTDKHPENREPEYWIMTQDGKAVAIFPTEKEAQKNQREIVMKYKVRNTEIVPFVH